ncbi:MAG: hypothetical protein JWO63_351, partial [Frankiales bacterium]|nr:hypothetical protein [Frankiales bacterium]
AGILWIQSAGNSAQDHWWGTLADVNSTGDVDLLAGTPNGEPGGIQQADLIEVAPGDSADIALTWDQWHTTPASLTLNVDDRGENDDPDTPPVTTSMSEPPENELGAPVRDITVQNNDSQYHVYTIYITHSAALPSNVRFDLTYAGAASPSLLADPSYWRQDSSYGSPSHAASGSVMEPATSPYALAAGAAYWGDKSLEAFSSRGPTISGVVKPEILGYDGVTSVSGASDLAEGFYGTSAAAPNVAGAAALVKGANPTWSADQIESFLETRATQGSTHRTGVAETNAAGFGDLQIGLPAAQYTALSAPYRLVDTRIGKGAPKARLGKGGVITISTAAAHVPATATSVVINLLGVNAAGSTYLSAYPTTFANTSNVNFATTDPTAAVGAVVPLSNGTFKVRNYSAKIDVVVDVLGYFAPTAGLRYQPLTRPVRVLDTRTSTGGHHRAVVNNEVLTQSFASSVVPSSADSVVVNVTVTDDRGSGWLSAYPSTYSGTSTLNYAKYARANLAVVKLNKATSLPSIKLRLSGASVDVVIDVLGYFSSSAPMRYVSLVNPVRLADSRSGVGIAKNTLTPNRDATVTAAGINGLPTSTAAVLASVTATGAGLGNITTFAAGQSLPLASTVNYDANRAVSNAASISLGSGGLFKVHESTPSPVIVDLFGYFIAG